VREFRKKKARKLKNIILALFQAETGPDRLKKRDIFFLIRNRFNPIRARKFLKKLKKLKKLILASFQADTGWDRPKKREKFSRSEPFLHDSSERIPKKIAKKFKNLKNILALFQAGMVWDRLKKREKIFLIQNRFFSTRA